MVGFSRSTSFSFDDIKLPTPNRVLMKSSPRKWNRNRRAAVHQSKARYEKYVLSDKLWSYLQEYAAKHKARSNGFGFGLVDGDSVSRTLSARYFKWI